MKSLLAFIVIAVTVSTSPHLAAQETDQLDDAAAMTACLERSRGWLNEGQPLPKSDDPAEAPRALADCIGAALGPCVETPEGMTTIGMAECLARETDWWDGLLNDHYRSLRETLDAESFNALREAQRAWITYSERNCGFQHTYWRAGTIRSTFHANCRLDMTARRAIKLEDFLGWSL